MIFLQLFPSKAGCPLAQYIMYNLLRDIGEYYTQHIMSNYSLILTDIFIFVATHESNFIEIMLRHECSSVNLLHIFRALFSKNTSRGLLLFDTDS